MLEHSEPSLTARFLTCILGEQIEHDSQRPFLYSLQGARAAARHAKQRRLVAISMLGGVGVNEDDTEEPIPTGRVDAAIHRHGDLLVVFEMKIGASGLDRLQLDRHAEKWKIAKGGRRFGQWSDIYTWAEREFASGPADAATCFLLMQFLEYLDMTDLAPFRGFRQADFEFFNQPSPELRPIVKNRLANLAEKALDLLTETEREEIGSVHVGQIGEGADHAWLHTHHGQDVVNLTIELHAEELQVNVVGWRRDQARHFERWLLMHEGLEELQTLDLHEFVLYERSAFNIDLQGTGAKPWWQRERFRRVASCAAPDISRAWIDALLARFNNRSWTKPGFHIRRSWPREFVIAAGEEIAGEVAGEVRRLLPLVQQIHAS